MIPKQDVHFYNSSFFFGLLETRSNGLSCYYSIRTLSLHMRILFSHIDLIILFHQYFLRLYFFPLKLSHLLSFVSLSSCNEFSISFSYSV